MIISDDLDPVLLVKKIQQLELIIDKQDVLITDAEVKEVRATNELLKRVSYDERLDISGHYSSKDDGHSSIPLINFAHDEDSI
jgi:hypothetical protein